VGRRGGEEKGIEAWKRGLFIDGNGVSSLSLSLEREREREYEEKF